MGFLGGGWVVEFQPIWKICSSDWKFSQFSGWKFQKSLKPPPRKIMASQPTDGLVAFIRGLGWFQVVTRGGSNERSLFPVDVQLLKRKYFTPSREKTGVPFGGMVQGRWEWNSSSLQCCSWKTWIDFVEFLGSLLEKTIHLGHVKKSQAQENWKRRYH